MELFLRDDQESGTNFKARQAFGSLFWLGVANYGGTCHLNKELGVANCS